MSKLLSIVIPSKDRYATLFHVISSITKFLDMESCEIVISDNSYSNQEVLNYLETFSDKKGIVYSYTSDSLSMVQNAERALGLASGKYLLFIGDDDFVSPYILDIVKMMEVKSIDSLTYPIANYFYGNVEFRKKYAFNNPSTLQITKNKDIRLLKKNTDVGLDRICSIGGIYIIELPRLYHGIIKRDLLESIKNRYGKYIPGPCPDMTLSVALAHIIENFYYIDYPVSISGASSASEGGKGPMNRHVVKLSDKKWLDPNDILDWDGLIPNVFSRETIWAQCLSHVNRISGDNRTINYRTIYSSMIINCPKPALSYVKPLYKSYIKSHQLSSFLFYKDYVKRFLKALAFKMPSFVWNKMVKFRGDYNKFNCVHQLLDIDECMQYIKKNYKI